MIYCFLLYFGSNKCRLGELKTLLKIKKHYKYYCLKKCTGSVYIVTMFALFLSVHCVAHICFVCSYTFSTVSRFPFQFPDTLLDFWKLHPRCLDSSVVYLFLINCLTALVSESQVILCDRYIYIYIYIYSK